MIYRVKLREIHQQEYVVSATTKEEAITKLQDAEGITKGQLEYIEPDENDWEEDNIRTKLSC